MHFNDIKRPGNAFNTSQALVYNIFTVKHNLNEKAKINGNILNCIYFVLVK